MRTIQDILDNDTGDSSLIINLAKRGRELERENAIFCREAGLEVATLVVQVARLSGRLDLMADEFKRIAATPGVTPEIRGICNRSALNIEQTTPLIAQRNNAEGRIACARSILLNAKQTNDVLLALAALA